MQLSVGAAKEKFSFGLQKYSFSVEVFQGTTHFPTVQKGSIALIENGYDIEVVQQTMNMGICTCNTLFESSRGNAL